MKILRSTLICGLGLVWALDARADSVTLGAVKDNTLYESVTGSLSNGAGGQFFSGLSGGGSIRRGLVAFDLNGKIPSGADIVSVTLTLDMSQTSSGPQPVSLHQVLADWGEGTSVAPGNGGGGAIQTPGDATWIHTFYPDSFWAAAGGDFEPEASATTIVDGIGTYTWSEIRMVGDVQAWLNDPATNFGWILLSNEAMATTAKRFSGKDNPDPTLHPVLVVEFEPAVVPATNALGALVLALALASAATIVLRARSLQR